MLTPALLSATLAFAALQQAPAPAPPQAEPVPAAHPADPNQAVSARFDPLWRQCIAGMSVKVVTQAVADTCKSAADLAVEFKPGTRLNDRRLVYMYAATAQARTGSGDVALRLIDQAVKVLDEGKLKGAPAEPVFALRARIKRGMGIAANPFPDADNAVMEARRMVKDGDPNGIAHLRADLLFEADLMQSAGKLADAGAVRVEADSLPYPASSSKKP